MHEKKYVKRKITITYEDDVTVVTGIKEEVNETLMR